MKLDILNLIGQGGEDEEFQMAPMIDIVFLLLIYFMVTTTIIKQEADLGMQLPGQVQQSTAVVMPDEQIIEVLADGRVILNGQVYDRPDSRNMPELTHVLRRFKQAADLSRIPAMITIQAEDDAIHQRVIDVMDACAAAGIKSVSFGMDG
ncbi:MAG: biopolymer transporter ExbD [Kiritimatiellae bacterium]|nr:biopolymer transporter ExbD [Kiritimatiellia bacterium]